MVYLKIGLTLLVFFVSGAQANTYDWMKTRVNKFWYDQYFEKCTPTSANQSSKFVPNSMSHCSRLSPIENETPELNSELKEATFFDAALNDQAVTNQCEFDYWSRLSTTPNDQTNNEQKKANQKLRSQFKSLNTQLKDFSNSTKNVDSAKEAQAQIIAELTNQSLKISELRKEINTIAATNPVFSITGDTRARDKIIQIENQIKVIESSMVFSEDPTVKDYVNAIILPKINDYHKLGQKPDLEEIKNYLLTDKTNSFQNFVVEAKLKSSSKQQMNYAKIDGNYKDNYNFKVQSVQHGAGSRMLNQSANQNTEFSSLQCELESKYGKGEKAADTANTIIISGITAVFGGATFALAKLAQIGIVSLRAAKFASALSSAVNGTISATMLAEGITDACFENHFGQNGQSMCARAEGQLQKSIKDQVSAEIAQSNCLKDLGLSAIAGIVSYKSFVTYQKLQKEKQLVDLGVKSKYEEIISNLNNNSELVKSDRSKIIAELNKSVKISSQEGFPRDSFIQAMAKENPEDLYMALKQINSDQTGKTWAEKVRKWLERNGVKGKEAKEMESCLIDQGSKVVSFCPFDKAQQKL